MYSLHMQSWRGTCTVRCAHSCKYAFTLMSSMPVHTLTQEKHTCAHREHACMHTYILWEALCDRAEAHTLSHKHSLLLSHWPSSLNTQISIHHSLGSPAGSLEESFAYLCIAHKCNVSGSTHRFPLDVCVRETDRDENVCEISSRNWCNNVSCWDISRLLI